MTPSLSVIVCTANREDSLSACLASLRRQHDPPTEIIVVDTDPEDTRARLLVQRKFPGCFYVSEPLKGLANARNRGLHDSVGEVVAYLDDRCRPVAGWSRALVRSFSKGAIVGCCTGPVLPLELKSRSQRLLENRGGFRKGFARSVFTRESLMQSSGNDPLHGGRFGTGSNMAFRRSVLSMIGPFDTGLYSADEIEMFYRLIQADFELVYEPGAVVFQEYPKTYKELRRVLHSMGRGHIRSLLRIAGMHPGYRKKALSEASAWFWAFQLRDRLCGRLTGKKKPFPMGLVLAELSGGVRAVAEHLFHSRAPAREPGATPGIFNPFIRILKRWT